MKVNVDLRRGIEVRKKFRKQELSFGGERKRKLLVVNGSIRGRKVRKKRETECIRSIRTRKVRKIKNRWGKREKEV